MNEWIFSPAHPRLGGAGQALNAVDAGRHAGQAFLPEHTHPSGHLTLKDIHYLRRPKLFTIVDMMHIFDQQEEKQDDAKFSNWRI